MPLLKPRILYVFNKHLSYRLWSNFNTHTKQATAYKAQKFYLKRIFECAIGLVRNSCNNSLPTIGVSAMPPGYGVYCFSP